MILKKSLKFTLPALLLAASASAFAAEEKVVTLSDGQTTKTWSEFVAAVNNLKSITGSIDDLEKTDPQNAALAAWTTAKKNLQTAKGVVEQKKTDKTTIETEADIAGKTTALETAKTGLNTAKSNKDTYVKETVGGKETAYNNNVSSLATKKDELASLQTQQNNLNTELAQATAAQTKAGNELGQANAALTKATADYTKYSNQLNNLPMTTKPETVDWLQTIYSKSTSFQKDYKAGNTQSKELIYCCLETYTYGFDDETATSLIFAFGSKPADGKTWTDYSPLNLSAYIKTLTAPDEFLIYLGPKYDELSGSNSEYIEFSYTGTFNAGNLVNGAVNILTTLKNNALYQISKTSYDDPDAAEELKELIRQAEDAMTRANNDINDANEKVAAADAKVGEINVKLNGRHGTTENPLPEGQEEVDGVIDQINTKQGEIDKLNNETIPNALKAWNDAKDGIAAYDTAIETAQGVVDEKQKALDDAQKKVDDAEQAIKDAEAEVTKADAAVTAAENAAQDAANAAEQAKYQQITLTGNVEATTPISVDYAGTIYGGNNVITNKTTGSQIIAGTFSGYMVNTAINGQFARGTRNASFENVAYWWSKEGGNIGRYYNNSGVAGDDVENLDELGYKARKSYGVDFENNVLVNHSVNSRVYKITVYDADGTKPESYVNVKGDEENGYKLYSVAQPAGFNLVNKFAESTESVPGVANIIYNGKCSKVVITDRQAFYCPKDIVADEVEYDRVFSERSGNGQNAVCLPFALKHAHNDNIKFLSTYSSEDDRTFWFNKVNEGAEVPANTPALLVATKSFSFTGENTLKGENGDGITIKATPMDYTLNGNPRPQMVATNSDEEGDNSMSFGIFKSTPASFFKGAVAADQEKIYGLATVDGVTKFYPAADNANFPAFRMVLYSPTVSKNNAPARRIGLRNEFGEDITEELGFTSIDGVKAQVTGVNVEGGKGEIIITAEAAQGDVAIYNVDGKMIAVADVVAGTTTVKVQTGVYIVMGKKVMVK